MRRSRAGDRTSHTARVSCARAWELGHRGEGKLVEENEQRMAEQRQEAAAPELAGSSQIDRRTAMVCGSWASTRGKYSQIKLEGGVEHVEAEQSPISSVPGRAGGGRSSAANAVATASPAQSCSSERGASMCVYWCGRVWCDRLDRTV